jgi:signal transduction histidine kinase
MVPGSSHRTDDHSREPAGQMWRRREQDRWRQRRLLQRQLHDGAALRISALALRLGLLRDHPTPVGQAANDCISELQDELHTVLEELRAVSAEIYPPLLDEAGLGPALREVADRLQIPLAVKASGERFGPVAEGAAYFALTCCLATRSPDAPSMTVFVRRENDELMLSVSGADACHAQLLADQAWPLGGTVEVVTGPQPAASTISVRIPCE